MITDYTQRYSTTAMGFFFRKFDPRIVFFDHVIQVLTEAGTMGHLANKYMPQGHIKEHEAVSDDKLTLEHFLIPNIFLMCMLSTSLVTLIAEFCYNSNNNNNNNNNNFFNF